jgi:hypothetical protein
MEVVKYFESAPNENSIVLICVIRDELLLLPAFIEHYRTLGVSHFIFIDNGSHDDSLLFLQKQQEGVQIQIWQTLDSYAENDYGMIWVNKVLSSQCKEMWCVVVDADEFVVLNGQLLPELKQQLERNFHSVAQFVLIDFYPREFTNYSVDNSKYKNPFLSSSFYDRIRSRQYHYFDLAPDNSFVIKGGVRQRIYQGLPANNQSVCLNKKSFFRYDFYNTHRLSAGMHWLFPHDFENWNYDNWDVSNQFVSYQERIHVIAHFKFARPDIYEYFLTRIERNQDWNNSEEFKSYLLNRKASFFDPIESREFSSSARLYDDTVNALMSK